MLLKQILQLFSFLAVLKTKTAVSIFILLFFFFPSVFLFCFNVVRNYLTTKLLYFSISFLNLISSLDFVTVETYSIWYSTLMNFFNLFVMSAFRQLDELISVMGLYGLIYEPCVISSYGFLSIIVDTELGLNFFDYMLWGSSWYKLNLAVCLIVFYLLLLFTEKKFPQDFLVVEHLEGKIPPMFLIYPSPYKFQDEDPFWDHTYSHFSKVRHPLILQEYFDFLEEEYIKDDNYDDYNSDYWNPEEHNDPIFYTTTSVSYLEEEHILSDEL